MKFHFLLREPSLSALGPISQVFVSLFATIYMLWPGRYREAAKVSLQTSMGVSKAPVRPAWEASYQGEEQGSKEASMGG